MMKRFSLLVSVLAFALLTHSAAADDASARALAAKLIDLTNGKQALHDGFNAVIDRVLQGMQAHGLPQQGVDEVKAAVNDWYDKEVNFAEIEPKMVDVYVKDFSEDELKAIVAFYGSPVGQKVITTLPAAMRESTVAAQEYTKSKIPDLNAALTPILQKYKEQMGGNPGPPSGNTPPPMPHGD